MTSVYVFGHHNFWDSNSLHCELFGGAQLIPTASYNRLETVLVNFWRLKHHATETRSKGLAVEFSPTHLAFKEGLEFLVLLSFNWIFLPNYETYWDKCSSYQQKQHIDTEDKK